MNMTDQRETVGGVSWLAVALVVGFFGMAVTVAGGTNEHFLPYVDAGDPYSSLAYTISLWGGLAFGMVNVDRLIRRWSEADERVKRAVYVGVGVLISGSFLWLPYVVTEIIL
ncbi:hypothetical protein FB469_3125 [Rathayibacter rathayi]|nr:hypothetical protein FB469_3125 [Rathayibacter rathayi]